MRKTRQFKQMLLSGELEFICEAHSGLSAKIVEEAGFKGIWASGLGISAQLGVRDNNEASWTQVLDVVEFMSDASAIPIMLDGDTGYGNFNNVQRLVRKLEQRDVAAVCLEDKLFPKTNSFISGKRQPLADIEEFAGKIKAGKDAQTDPDFCIVARVEAFIAGWGLDEAVRRAEAYRAAGADAILIHSALSTPDEILAFTKEWANRSPVVIVPTKYYATPTDVFRANQVSMVIWANHILRSSVTAMQKTARALYKDQELIRIESGIAPVSEIFRLQGADALDEAERRYLPSSRQKPSALVLAASRGVELGDLTKSLPKTMIPVGGKPVLSHIAAAYNQAGIRDITVVRGYCKERVDLPSLDYVDNDEFETSGELVSLQKGLKRLADRTNGIIVSYGDVLFRKHVPDILNEVSDDLVVMIDTQWRESANLNRVADYARCSRSYSRLHYSEAVHLQRLGDATELREDEIHGEWMGFFRIGPASQGQVRDILDQMLSSAHTRRKGSLPDLINTLVERGLPVRVVYTTGHWLDIDSPEDVASAGSF
ncbi:phosphoenolpyruvate mutase [Niveibacterium terrae]|uniref:phosphoenolpyruvate mutase n=1 Tax=Niveibacterium terrae TaxID=3373598 RepID=UPI003A8F42F9